MELVTIGDATGLGRSLKESIWCRECGKRAARAEDFVIESPGRSWLAYHVDCLRAVVGSSLENALEYQIARLELMASHGGYDPCETLEKALDLRYQIFEMWSRCAELTRRADDLLNELQDDCIKVVAGGSSRDEP